MNALISVYDKEGIEQFAKDLVELGWTIYASGGTAKRLLEAGLEVTDVAGMVGGGAILGHRVVTLSREVHAGLLSRDIEEDNKELAELNIPRFDLVCVDTYPMEATINKDGATRESVIEQTDVGGPTMLASAAKGDRIVICQAADRSRVIDWLKNDRPEEEAFRQELRAKTYQFISRYIGLAARFHSDGKHESMHGDYLAACKYGENPWLTPAAIFGAESADPLAMDKFKKVAGTDPSFINWTDIDRLLQTITHIGATFETDFKEVPAVALGAKHGNCCGAAFNAEPAEALKKMVEGDPLALFGGVVMVNFEIDEKLAEILVTHKTEGNRILDGVVAPAFSEEAIDILSRKKGKCRLIVNEALAGSGIGTKALDIAPLLRPVRGGFLKQPNYTFVYSWSHPELVLHGELSPEQKKDLSLGWAVGSTSNSNTITLIKDGMLIGNGVGQQSRVGAAKLAIMRATDSGHDVAEAVAYSDSFFPFPDGPLVLAEAGVKAALASSGSVKDAEVAEQAKEAGLVMTHIPDKAARGFYHH